MPHLTKNGWTYRRQLHGQLSRTCAVDSKRDSHLRRSEAVSFPGSANFNCLAGVRHGPGNNVFLQQKGGSPKTQEISWLFSGDSWFFLGFSGFVCFTVLPNACQIMKLSRTRKQEPPSLGAGCIHGPSQCPALRQFVSNTEGRRGIVIQNPQRGSLEGSTQLCPKSFMCVSKN